MPAVDLDQLVRSAVQKNQSIPAVLDAYSEFLDSTIGPLELQDLESVFAAISGNVSERFPQVASSKAVATARNDIAAFLSAAGGNAERVKDAMRRELAGVSPFMAASIGERLSRSTPDEKRALDATLRLVRRSREDILFRGEPGRGIESSGAEFARFFTSVKAESPTIRELRFQNLIVEKAIFNKLVLKSRTQSFPIWVPSFFAKENVSALIERLAVSSEHLLLSNLREMKASGGYGAVKDLLSELLDSQGLLSSSSLERVPEQIRDFFVKVQGSQLSAISPLELDDIAQFLSEIAGEERAARAREAEEQRRRAEEEEAKAEQAREQKLLQRRVATATRVESSKPANYGSSVSAPIVQPASGESIYLGKALDLQQLVSALAKRLPESEIKNQVRTVGEYYVDCAVLRKNGVAIVGASGSGRSMTLRRILDGLAANSGSRVVVVDQRGEHRGIAWKHQWQVFAFAADSQAKQIRIPLLSSDRDDSELLADLLQEWCLSNGVACSEPQRARIASIVRSEREKQSLSAETLAQALAKEPDLSQIASKLGKNLLSRNLLSRIFSNVAQGARSEGDSFQQALKQDNSLFDISGRGLREVTTREERLIATALILRELAAAGTKNSVIVLEDFFDRFKSESLKRKVLELAAQLRANGNVFVATARSEVRGFVGPSCLELLHRLSGEKIVSEELAGFRMDHEIRGLPNLISFLPRGYALSSRADGESQLRSAAIRIEPLQFT